MATTRLSDVIVPQKWTPNFLLESPQLVAFFNSGIVQQDQELSRLAAGEGQKYGIRHMNALADEDENISSDDPDQNSVPSKTSTGQQLAVKLMRNKSWSSMDMVAALNDPDPVAAIRAQVGDYWSRRFQRAAISVIKGVCASNVASNGGDMLYDHTASAATDKTIAGDAIIKAWATMGDAAGDLSSIVMHSVQFTTLQQKQLISYLPAAGADVALPTYLGKRVVVDDSMPVTGAGTGADPFKYLAALYGPGALRFGMGAAKMPVEVDRKPSGGNGEGEEILYSRQHFIIHPRGFSNVSAAANPNNAQLETAASWSRVFQRKQIPLAFVRTL